MNQESSPLWNALAVQTVHAGSEIPTPSWMPLLQSVGQCASGSGRTDSLYTGLRYYRFSEPVSIDKKQTLMPGLVLVLQGRKTIRLGKHTLAYDPQQYLVLASEAICHSAVVSATAQQPYVALHLDLPLDVVAKTLVGLAQDEAESAAPPSPPVDAFVLPLDPTIVNALLRLQYAVADPIERRLLAPLVIEEIVLRLLRCDAAAALRRAVGAARSGKQIQTAMQFMQQHHAQPLSVAQVAEHVAMSPSHFAHQFRAVARVSPMRYLREVRLNEARNLMLSHGLRAQQAAVQVGFDSASHFSREFKSSFGMAPSDYVRRLLDR